MAYLEFLGGLIYLLFGGDLLVRGAVAMARRARVSPMIVGLTVVALGTSAPELVVSVGAVLGGHADLALGNVVGSNIANVLVVLGVPALVYAMPCDQPSIRGDAFVMLGVSGLFVAVGMTGGYDRVAGLLLLLCGVGFFWRAARHAFAAEGRAGHEAEQLERVLGLPTQRRMITAFLVVGVILLPLGADLMVSGGTEIAESLGVSEALIGITIFALGTSLPELATTVLAALQKHDDVAIGNVLGSNILNLVVIMGVASSLSPGPIAVSRAFQELHLPALLFTAVLLVLYAERRTSIGRRSGLVFLALYVAYLATAAIVGVA